MEVKIIISKEDKWKRITVKTSEQGEKEDIKTEFCVTGDTQITIIQ